MKLFIVRHAETSHNKRHLLHGVLDVPLSPEGRKQAQKLAKKLSRYKIDAIYSSDRKRCRETLQPFLKKTNLPVHYVKALRERDFGIFEGKPAEELKIWIKKNGLEGNYSFKMPKGESFQDVKKRISRLLSTVFKKYKGKNILIICHGGTSVSLLLNLLNKKDEAYPKYSAKNAALTIIDIKNNGKPEMRLFNSTTYLQS